MTHRLSVSMFALSLALCGTLVAQERERGQEPAPKDTPTEGAPDLAIQEWLLSRTKYDDYQKATFSFEFGLRDDPELEVTRNDWELLFGNNGRGTPDQFDVRMVRDDISTIADLGVVDFEGLTPAMAEGAVVLETVPCTLGHLYAVHTMDGETDRFALFRVDAHKKGDSTRIAWIAFDDNGLRSSPGLTVDKDLQKKLRSFVQVLKRRGGLDYCLRVSEAASEVTFDRLTDTRVKEIPPTFGALLDRIAELPGVKVEFGKSVPDERKAWRDAEVPYDVRVRDLRDALEITTRSLRLSWVVRTDGAVVIRKA